ENGLWFRHSESLVTPQCYLWFQRSSTNSAVDFAAVESSIFNHLLKLKNYHSRSLAELVTELTAQRIPNMGIKMTVLGTRMTDLGINTHPRGLFTNLGTR
ncbi:hypothetical protein, partial [Ellagibacter isourolithinifaciens]|uniref:hypothetical protein n=1 Tax=Ellagibacter isourolithinifaciens TaxID=2137581 RepID=UPI0023F2A7E5